MRWHREEENLGSDEDLNDQHGYAACVDPIVRGREGDALVRRKRFHLTALHSFFWPRGNPA